MSQQINLFNPIFLTKKKYFSAVAMAQGLAIIAAGLSCLSIYSAFQVKSLTRDLGATKASLEQTKTSLEKIKLMSGARQKSKSLEDAIRQAEGDVSALQHISRALKGGDFGNTEGYSEYFHAFSRQIVHGIWMTGFTIQGAGTEIALQGRALQADLVPTYLNRLKKEPVMQGKSFAALEISRPQEEMRGTGAEQETKKGVHPAYVEFALKSQGLAKPVSETTGASLR